MASLATAPAKFAPDPRRRALLGKVHVAKKQLGLDDDTYEGVLFGAVGKTSAAECSEPELVKVLDHFKRRGFVALPGKKVGGRGKAADHPMARKARAMWISLYHLGAVRSPAEAALEGFAKRQLGVEALQWADQGKCYKLVEALKAMAEREGWSQRVDHVAREHQAFALKRKLVDAIFAKMKAKGMVAADWSIGTAAFSLCGIGQRDQFLFEDSELDLVARSLGEKLRSFGAGA